MNEYNNRITADTVKVANAEVELAEARIEQAEIAMTKFRQQYGDLDPQLSGTADMGLIATLSGQLAQSEAQLAQMQGLSPDSPQVEAVRNRISAIRQQIAAQNSLLTGANGALAPGPGPIPGADVTSAICTAKLYGCANSFNRRK